jgi:ketosteroid isomerase-like protein
MKTEDLQANQISPEAYRWYLGYLAAIDGKNIEQYATYLADDCVMVQNNNEPVRGKAAIVAGLTQYWQSFGELEHALLNIFGRDDAFVLEAWNHYVRLDGKRVSVRAVAITERNEAGLVRTFRFYTDVSPVFA